MSAVADRATFRDTILAAFNAAWDGATEVAWPNVPFDPAGGASSHIRVHFGQTSTERYLGTRAARRVVPVYIDIWTPVASGPLEGYDLAERALEFVESYQPAAYERTLRNPSLTELPPSGGYAVIRVQAECAYIYLP